MSRSLILLFLLAPTLAAAPPALTHLYPAGGQRGRTVEVLAGGTFGRWPVRTWIEGKGVEVRADAKTRGKLSVTIAPDAAPGPRWMRLIDDDGASVLRRFIVGSLPEVLDQEPNDEIDKPQRLTGPGVVVNGRLEKAGDVDCFSLPLRKGQTLVASVDASRSLASPMDAVLQIVSDRGFVLAQNHDHHGLDPQVAFPVPADGTYVVRLFCFPSVPDTAVRFSGGERHVYRLTLTTGGFAEHAFPLAIERGKGATVELVGWNIPEAGRKVVVAANEESDHGTAALPDVVGSPSVRLEPHPCVTHQPPGDRKKPHELTLPVTVTGRLDVPGEGHAYRFACKKGQRLSCQVESATLGFSVDAVATLTGPGGKLAAQTRTAAVGRDPELAYTVPLDGIYQLEIRDLYEASGPRHLYRLRVLLGGEFGLSVASDLFAVAPGKTLDVPVTIARRNGIVQDLALRVEGLPEGVRAEVLPGTGATRTIRLTADARATGGGAFRIVGEVRGQGASLRLARAPLAEYATGTTQLWVSVGGSVPPPVKKKRR